MDALEIFAADAFGGKLLQGVPNELVLASGAAKLQLPQAPPSRKLHDYAKRRRQLLFQLGSVWELLQKLVEDLSGLLVALALQIESGDLLVVLGVRRIGLFQQDFLQRVARDGAGGHPHVPYVLDPFDLDPLRRQFRNALDDVKGSSGSGHREDPTAELVEWLDAERLTDDFDGRAGAGHALTNRELLIDLPAVLLANLANQPLREEGPPQFVIENDDILDRAAFALGRQRGLAQGGDAGEFSVQHATVLQHDLSGPYRFASDDGARRQQ